MEGKNRRQAAGSFIFFLSSNVAYVHGEHFSIPAMEREGFVLFVAFLLGMLGNSIQKITVIVSAFLVCKPSHILHCGENSHCRLRIVSNKESEFCGRPSF